MLAQKNGVNDIKKENVYSGRGESEEEEPEERKIAKVADSHFFPLSNLGSCCKARAEIGASQEENEGLRAPGTVKSCGKNAA